MKKYNPTSPSRRQMIVADYSVLTEAVPYRPLVKKLKKRSGRNSQGRITVRHRGGGNKKRYRMVDFGQMKRNIPGRIETLEYDPYRTAFIARVAYRDGERRYMLAPKGLDVGSDIVVSEQAPLKDGNRLPIKNIPIGYFVHNVELLPGQGGKIIRSAGASAQVLAQEGRYANLKMPSGEVRMVLGECWASLGQVSNAEHNLVVIGKAGKTRLLGRRPVVRGSAMNPRDHPYGGGEGRAQRGTKRPKTKWGKVTGGRKTRKKKKWSNALILQRRKNIRNRDS